MYSSSPYTSRNFLKRSLHAFSVCEGSSSAKFLKNSRAMGPRRPSVRNFSNVGSWPGMWFGSIVMLRFAIAVGVSSLLISELPDSGSIWYRSR